MNISLILLLTVCTGVAYAQYYNDPDNSDSGISFVRVRISPQGRKVWVMGRPVEQTYNNNYYGYGTASTANGYYSNPYYNYYNNNNRQWPYNYNTNTNTNYNYNTNGYNYNSNNYPYNYYNQGYNSNSYGTGYQNNNYYSNYNTNAGYYGKKK